MIIQFMISVVALIMTSCNTTFPTQTNFKNPSKVCELPAELMEISGITDVDGKTVACVQDELGDVFIYDLENCTVIEQITFEGPGDFEGLTRVGNDMYALRSDGAMFKIVFNENGKPDVQQIDTKIPALDNEGLCYDEKHNRLLLAPRRKYTDKAFEKSFRAIYAFDLATEKMMDKPALQISVSEVLELVERKKDIELFRKGGTGEVKFKFNIASIAAHPEKELYYLLISSEQFLLTVDGQGKPLDVLPLDNQMFPKPEGITFLDAKSLVVSSEGGDTNPVLALFSL
ncbi:MAG: SdiA-regulated domain-containing protein [Saprospiraceae bacterium]|nr:SdiA-regulated domain-containing protein [Saprospiraceae bacterium]